MLTLNEEIMEIISLLIFHAFGNVVAWYLMGRDKTYAVNQQWRIAEWVLVLPALFCGPFGNLIGMWSFWHKIRKRQFHLPYFRH